MNDLAIQQGQMVRSIFSGAKVPKKLFMAGLQTLEDTLMDTVGVTLRNDDRTPLVHRFAPGLYAREIKIPATYLLVTGIHATEHFAIISKGKCLVATEDGVQVVQAGDTLRTKICTKRAIYVLEDLQWTTVHAIDASTPEEAIGMIEYKGWEDCKWLFG